MKTKMGALVAVAALVLASVALAQPADPTNPPLVNWTAAPYWTPPRAAAEGTPEGRMEASAEGMTASAQTLPSSPVPFVAIAPCRIVDTRVPVSDGFHEPNFADGETRTFNIPASTDCPGLPATSVAYSFNVQYRPLSVLAFITLFPTGTTLPTVSTLTAGPTAWVEDAAIVPAGTSGAIDVYCQYAGRVVIDINGYYAAQSLVSSLNTLTGDVILSPGSNVTITPSGNTLTIAATGGPGGVLPTGSTGQTLYHNGSAWTASSALTNDGANVGISGNLSFPNTTGSTGQINFGGSRFIHNYGTGNTFVGQQAGNLTMTGGYNTASGDDSLFSDTTGSDNTASGTYSLFSDTTGSDNTASGFASLLSNITGSGNTANGSYGLYSNSTGSYNTAVGGNTLASNGTASQNTAVGSGALQAQSYDPGFTWTSDNTAVGFNALTSNQPTLTGNGFENTAIGSQALPANTTGSENTASGYRSMYANTTGSGNTATGWQSLDASQTGYENEASGAQSLWADTTGAQNTASGYQSLVKNTTGFQNTASGTFAGLSNITGSYNTFVGYEADAATSALTNATAIGHTATVNASNKVRIGNASVTVIEGQVAWSFPSDARLKENIRDLDLGLDFVMRLRPVSFTMKQGNGRTDMGFLAQEVEAVLGDGYNVLGIGADRDRTLSLRGTDLIAPLVKAVQEQQARIDAQQTQIAALTAKLADSDAQRAQLETVTARLAALEKVVAGPR